MRYHNKDTKKDARIITLYQESENSYSLGISNPMTLALCRRLQLDHEVPYLCDFITQSTRLEKVLQMVEEKTGIKRGSIHIKTYLYDTNIDIFKGLQR